MLATATSLTYVPMSSFKTKLQVGYGYVLMYAAVWLPLFGVSWLLDKGVNDSTTETIFNCLYYAGYPVYAAVLVPLGAIYAIGLGVFWVVMATAPYSLYLFAFAPVIILTIWAKRRLFPLDTHEEQRLKNREQLRKNKPFNPFDSDTKL